MYDRVNDKDLFLRVLRQSSRQLKRKKSPLYLFVWLPREDAGLSATGGPFLAVGIKPFAASPPITASEVNVGIPQPPGW